MFFRRIAPDEQVLAVKRAVGSLHMSEFDREDVERVAKFFGRDENGHLVAHLGPPSDDGAHLAQIAGRKALGNYQELVVRSFRIAGTGYRRTVNYDRHQIPVLRRL